MWPERDHVQRAGGEKVLCEDARLRPAFLGSGAPQLACWGARGTAGGASPPCCPFSSAQRQGGHVGFLAPARGAHSALREIQADFRGLQLVKGGASERSRTRQ